MEHLRLWTGHNRGKREHVFLLRNRRLRRQRVYNCRTQVAGPRLFDQDFPEEYKHEAQVGIDSLAMLETTDAGLDWFFVHPAEVFGPWAEGERTGHYRDGGDVLVRDAEGKSYISGADFAVAVVDEIEQGNHHRERFTVGY